MAIVTCPTCGFALPESSDFCPNCGRPRTAVQHELEERARKTGVPYIQLLNEARSALGITVPTVETQRQLTGDLHALRQTLQQLEARVNQLEGGTVPMASAAPAPLPAPAEPMVEQPVTVAMPAQPADVPLVEATVAAAPRIEPQLPPRVSEPLPEPRTAPPKRDLEDLISGRVLAWTGGVAILIGALFFLSMAFSRGWIGPTARVAIGFAAAAGMLAGGAWLFERRERLFGHVLVGVGLGVMNIALLAATQLYDLIPVPLGLLIALVTALAAAVIAIRANSQVVALFGLFAALIAPPIVGAEPALSTVAFVGVVLVGTTTVALYRSWSWLPPLAFVLSVPQAADLLVGDVNIGLGLLVLTAYWLLFAIAAGGEEFRLPRGRLGITSTTLMLANAAYLVAMGFALLDGDAEPWRGLFLVGVAAAHGLLGGYFLKTRGDFHPFGMLAVGTGIAALTIAIPVQFGGPVVPLAWAAEAVALTWLYVRRRHIYSGLYAIALGALAIGHLLLFEYPLWEAAEAGENTWPFLNANGATLAFLLLALAAAGYFIAVRRVRAVLAALGLVLVILTMPHELSNVGLLAGWALVFVAALGLPRWPALDDEPATSLVSPLTVPALLAAAFAVVHLLTFELPLSEVRIAALPDIPFTDQGTLAVVVLAAAAVAGSFLTRQAPVVIAARLAAVALAAYLMPFELGRAAVVVAWSALAVGLALLGRRDRAGVQAYLAGGGVLLGISFLTTLATVAPPRQFVDLAGSAGDHPPFWSGATAALGAMAAALLAVQWLYSERQELVRAARLAAVALAAYLMPFELGRAATVVAWSALAVGLALLGRRDRAGAQAYLAGVGVLLGAAFYMAVLMVAPATRLVVDAGSAIDHLLLWSGATAAIGALVAALLIVQRLYPEYQQLVRAARVLAGGLVVYLLSVGAVDHFQSQVGGDTSLETLQKQAQVALSILWAVLGVGVFVAGILRFGALTRAFGLALLALATVKVFIMDLASLDTSYRVLSFIGLGILLLVGSFVYQHFKQTLIHEGPNAPPGGSA